MTIRFVQLIIARKLEQAISSMPTWQ